MKRQLLARWETALPFEARPNNTGLRARPCARLSRRETDSFITARRLSESPRRTAQLPAIRIISLKEMETAPSGFSAAMKNSRSSPLVKSRSSTKGRYWIGWTPTRSFERSPLRELQESVKQRHELIGKFHRLLEKLREADLSEDRQPLPLRPRTIHNWNLANPGACR